MRNDQGRRTALIVGCEGQDGSYLTEELRRRNTRVIGLSRASVYDNGAIISPVVSLNDAVGIKGLLATFQPDQIYYLAAYHHSSEQLEAAEDVVMRRSLLVHVDGLEIMLSAACGLVRRPRVFLASSSHVFGNPLMAPQNEETTLRPVSAYGVTKHMAMQLCEFYTSDRDLFCASGIFYNHESSRRPAHFVSRRIVDGVLGYSRGGKERVLLGNLSAVVDWGAAQDYVRAVISILEQDLPERFVIASGIGRTVADFVEVACRTVGVDPADAVGEDTSVTLRGGKSAPLIGDASKLLGKTDWRPRIDFETMVQGMIAESGGNS
jgi:GDPmannose 4,6-dehydratase